jgi:chemotaxis protein MotB
MAENDEQQPIIVIKKKGGHAGHHGGAWKVAYADFVTAMMAFFLVMWIVAQSQSIKESVSGYFNDPSGWGKKAAGGSMLKGSQSMLKGGQSVLKNGPPPPRTEEQAREILKQASEHIKEALNSMAGFAAMKNLVEIEMTPEGLKIQLMEALKSSEDSSYFFGSGSATLSPWGEEIMTLIAKELGKLDNKIVIEGHTDSHQFVSKNKYTNWELSADRANSARRLMETNGLRSGQVWEIRGYADKQPRFKDNPRDARNRRIAIIVMTDDGQVKLDGADLHSIADGNGSKPQIESENKTENSTH